MLFGMYCRPQWISLGEAGATHQGSFWRYSVSGDLSKNQEITNNQFVSVPHHIFRRDCKEPMRNRCTVISNSRTIHHSIGCRSQLWDSISIEGWGGVVGMGEEECIYWKKKRANEGGWGDPIIVSIGTCSSMASFAFVNVHRFPIISTRSDTLLYPCVCVVIASPLCAREILPPCTLARPTSQLFLYTLVVLLLWLLKCVASSQPLHTHYFAISKGSAGVALALTLCTLSALPMCL